jgi:hypothetical protein
MLKIKTALSLILTLISHPEGVHRLVADDTRSNVKAKIIFAPRRGASVF